jgi:hypothetical protein
MYFSTTSTAAALLLLLGAAPSATVACPCSKESSDTITKEVMEYAKVVGRLYVRDAIHIPDADGNIYYAATAQKWYKAGEEETAIIGTFTTGGGGNLIVKTSAAKSECGAAVSIEEYSVLFGTVSYEHVPGQTGKKPTLTIDNCQPQKVAHEVTKAEWETLAN